MFTAFESYTKGFIKACGASIYEKEMVAIPIGAKLMILECGMRFLTDYLEGDTYFKPPAKITIYTDAESSLNWFQIWKSCGK